MPQGCWILGYCLTCFKYIPCHSILQGVYRYRPKTEPKELKANSLIQSDGNCQIQFSSLGYDAVSFGAAALVLDKVLMNLEPLNENSAKQAVPLFHLLS
jgi:hypothetical protein